MFKITAVVITKNEEAKIESCLKALNFADEILVIDDSEDQTPVLAGKVAKVKVISSTGTPTTLRNIGLEKASGDWILMIDADERLEENAETEIRKAVEENKYSAYAFPRKNFIFGKWIEHAGWYPDYQVRLIKKGKAVYSRLVHEVAEVKGETGRLNVHIIHNNYETISQFLDKLQRYTSLEAEELVLDGYKFVWTDLLLKSNSEILRRFFAEEGYKDGLHGLTLSILQGFYTFVVYLKVWEKEKFKEEKDVLKVTEKTMVNINKEWEYWFLKTLPHNLLQKIKSKI